MLPTIATGNVGSALAGEYEVANSLRFDDGSNDYLTRTFSAGNRKTWSFSTWIKRCNLTNANMNILGTDYSGSGEAYLLFKSGEQLHYGQYEGGGTSNNYSFQTNQAFRDNSAWYNILFVWDTTQSTSSDRMKLYVNGTQVTSFSSSTYPSLNLDGVWNSGRVHYIGDAYYGTNLDGYLCETVFCDGTVLSPTDVGEFDDSGIWKPIDVSGLSFGTNGFYQEYKQSGTSANSSGLGADTSGNDHHFTVNNLTAVDQSTDTCTNNGCTLNPLVQAGSISSGATHTFSNGNLSLTGGTSKWIADYGTFALTTGKWFYEIKLTTFSSPSGSPIRVGWGAINDVVKDNNIYFRGLTYDLQGIVRYGSGGTDGGTTTGRTAFVQGDIVSIAIDIDNDEITFYKNGSVTNVEDFDYSSLTTNIKRSLDFAIAPHIVMYANNSNAVDYNFGSPPYSESGGNSDGNGYGNFSMAVPSGYYSLNSKNLAEFG